MSSAANNPALTGVSDPNPNQIPTGSATPGYPPLTPIGPVDPMNPQDTAWGPNQQMLPGGTPAQPPPTAMGAQQLPPPSGTGVPMPTGKGGGPSIPTTPSPPPMGPFDPMMGSARTAGDVRLPNTAGAHMAQGYDIAQGLADTLNRVGQGGGNDPWSTGTVPSPIPDPVMDPTTLTGPWLGPQLPNMPPKRQNIRTGPRSKYPSGALTRPPAVPMRDPTMPSPSTGYSIPFGKRRRGLV